MKKLVAALSLVASVGYAGLDLTPVPNEAASGKIKQVANSNFTNIEAFAASARTVVRSTVAGITNAQILAVNTNYMENVLVCSSALSSTVTVAASGVTPGFASVVNVGTNVITVGGLNLSQNDWGFFFSHGTNWVTAGTRDN